MKQQETNQTKLLTIDQVAKMLPVKIQPQTIARWVKKGARGRKLPARRIGGRFFIYQTDLEQFLQCVNQ